MSNPSEDARTAIYDDLHHNQVLQQEEANRHSARVILSLLHNHFAPRSVLDVGCGIGTWLEAAQELGATEVLGIEGDWLDRRLVHLPEQSIVNLDLERPFDLKRRFDLVICLEVAEHLQPAAAAAFVESLVRHADVVLFSAAIPYQGGHHHVNEQFLDYWSDLFQRFAYRPIDFIRPVIWKDGSVLWWLRQNMVVFARQGSENGESLFAGVPERAGPLSIVHPDVYYGRLKEFTASMEQHQKLTAMLASCRTCSITRLPNGQFTIERLS